MSTPHQKISVGYAGTRKSSCKSAKCTAKEIFEGEARCREFLRRLATMRALFWANHFLTRALSKSLYSHQIRLGLYHNKRGVKVQDGYFHVLCLKNEQPDLKLDLEVHMHLIQY